MNEQNIYIGLGKVDYNGTGRRINDVCITVRLYYRQDGSIEFAASGDIWNGRHTDIIAGGQILDEIMTLYPKLQKNKGLFLEIYQYWKKYHLAKLPPKLLSRIEDIIGGNLEENEITHRIMIKHEFEYQREQY